MYQRRAMTLALALLLLVPALAGAQESLAPSAWDAGLTLTQPADRNPDPNILEIDLKARLADVTIGGTTVKAWTYDGLLPGPLIRAKVGDRLIVHFTNELPARPRSTGTACACPSRWTACPASRSRTSRRASRSPTTSCCATPGLYWYHPHVMSAAQVGVRAVRRAAGGRPGGPVGVADQLTLVLSDIGFDAKGVLEPADSGGSAGKVFGREGYRAGERPGQSAAAGQGRRAAAVAHREHVQEPLFSAGPPGPAVHRHRDRRRAAGTSRDDAAVAHHAGRAAGRLLAPTGAPGSELPLRSMLYNRGYGSVEFRSVETLLTIAFSQEPALDPRRPAGGDARRSCRRRSPAPRRSISC